MYNHKDEVVFEEIRADKPLVGTKCHICTGCGRCFGRTKGISVVTDGGLVGYWQKQVQNAAQAGCDCALSGIDCARAGSKLIAVDIGTTTIAMVLYSQDGREEDRFVTVNPQVRFGADVLSRIQAASEGDVAENMKQAVRQVLASGIKQFKSHNPCINLQMVIAANTTMIYLLMGYDPEELGMAPFQASHLEKIDFTLEGVPATILPGLKAFVGADILSGIYAGRMAEREEITLLIDLGTNGEMAIGNRYGLTACSTAAGPAFEGDATKGIWGADMVHLTAELLKAGILDETGLIADTYFDDGVRIGDVLITQQSIRSLQLAKAAIAAGVELVADAHGLKSMEQIDKVILAGGFGYFLNAQDAAEIGLLPVQLVDKVVSGGNTALAGILRYGTEGSSQAGNRIQEIVKMTKTINLAEQKDFQDKYIQAMYLKRW